jgi:hypothetical protein
VALTLVNKQGAEIVVNARKEADIVNPNTGALMELDIYIPSLQLAFEYQVYLYSPPPSLIVSHSILFLKEKHHYTSTEWVYFPLHVTQQRDEMKRNLARAKGISLIIVPCWWDGKSAR